VARILALTGGAWFRPFIHDRTGANGRERFRAEATVGVRSARLSPKPCWLGLICQDRLSSASVHAGSGDTAGVAKPRLASGMGSLNDLIEHF
jgi:hypothetical protein